MIHRRLAAQFLVVVDGDNDIEFPRRASAILRAENDALPDLSQLERRGRIARGVEVRFSDDDHVADLVAERSFLRRHPGERWNELSARTRQRLRNRAKSWHNTLAVDRISVARFAHRDPAGELHGWLRMIAELAAGFP